MNAVREPRKRVPRILLLASVAVVASSTAAMSTAAAPAAPGTLDAQREQFLALPFVHEVADDTVKVDFSTDPVAAAAALAASPDVLDGLTINVEGIRVEDSGARRQADGAASAGDVPIAPALCPDRPEGPRSTDGTTVPYLGCDPLDGEERTAAVVMGDAATSLTAAFDRVLAATFQGATLPRVTATVSDGDVVVNIPIAAGELALQLPKADGVALDRALLFTAYSNGAVDTIQFMVDGDCRLYALSVGGDMCSTVSFPIAAD